MSIRVKIDATSQLKKMAKKLEKIEEAVKVESLMKVMNRLGTIWTGDIKQGFLNSRDPYGQSWAALKNPSNKRGGLSAKPLLDRGRLVGSIDFVTQDNKLIISTNVNYAEYHQDGTARIRKRAFLPDERGLPDKFKNDLEQALESILKNMI